MSGQIDADVAAQIESDLGATGGSQSIWNLPAYLRGVIAEKLMGGNNLGGNFPTFDRFDEETGIATSYKTIDLGLKSYADNGGVLSVLKRYINDARDFPGGSQGLTSLEPEQITGGRQVIVGVPAGMTPIQESEIEQAIQYGASPGVNVSLTIMVLP